MDKKHIILVNPSHVTNPIVSRTTYSLSPEFPLNLGLLGSVLIDNGYSVDLINYNVHEDWKELIFNILNERTDIAYVGFTAMSSQVESAYKTAKEIKQKHPEVPIVFGGVHVTLVPEGVVKGGVVDFCVVNEGDVAVIRLAEYVNGKIPIESVPNLVTLKDGKLLVTEKAPPSTFDSLPQVMHPSLYEKDMPKYLSSNRPFSLLTGLGCNYNCAFCINNITKRRYRPKKAESIYAEAEALHKKYNITNFIFQDEHFFSDRPRLFKLLELIESNADFKIGWVANVRVTDICDSWLNVQLLKRLVNDGCNGLGTGGESGSDRMLWNLRKGSRYDILRVAKFCNEAKMNIGYSFVVLWVGETKEDIIMTAQVIRKLLKTGKYSVAPYFQTYRPYPGSIWEKDLSPFENPRSYP